MFAAPLIDGADPGSGGDDLEAFGFILEFFHGCPLQRLCTVCIIHKYRLSASGEGVMRARELLLPATLLPSFMRGLCG